MLAVVRGDFVPPSVLAADFPPALEQVICTALAIDPADRYPSAAALLEALEVVATLESWTLGTGATRRMMAELFGAQPQPTRVMTNPRRDWHDEAPTRGRRSLTRFCAPAVAA